METRANHVWVGIVTIVLLGGLALFSIWLARLGGNTQQEYDIFFQQSVNGIAQGSNVSFSGVPSGQVTEISLWEDDPDFVRVRIAIDSTVPVLEGTTATIQGVGFTGVSEIQLDGAVAGAPPIREPGPEGVPVIPTRPGALGELLNNAPLLLDRLATLTERLTQTLSEENQEAITGLLENSERLTGALANEAPEFGNTMRELQATLVSARSSLERFDQLAGSLDSVLTDEGRPLAQQLRATLASAETSLAEIESTVRESRPGLRQFSQSTLPETEALVRDLREMTAAITAIAETLDQEGAGGLLSQPALPDYDPN